MTKDELIKQGWEFTSKGDNWTAEKGPLIFMGPEAMVLAMASKFTS